ncbi:IQ motif and SEC7 domain-containing protein 3 [Manis javanica]|nr:IQ motif and SEC7 domain-containing protein 3 [Manis javanica]
MPETCGSRFQNLHVNNHHRAGTDFQIQRTHGVSQLWAARQTKKSEKMRTSRTSRSQRTDMESPKSNPDWELSFDFRHSWPCVVRASLPSSVVQASLSLHSPHLLLLKADPSFPGRGWDCISEVARWIGGWLDGWRNEGMDGESVMEAQRQGNAIHELECPDKGNNRSESGFLPGSPPSRNSLMAAKPSDKKSEQFPEKGFKHSSTAPGWGPRGERQHHCQTCHSREQPPPLPPPLPTPPGTLVQCQQIVKVIVLDKPCLARIEPLLSHALSCYTLSSSLSSSDSCGSTPLGSPGSPVKVIHQPPLPPPPPPYNHPHQYCPPSSLLHPRRYSSSSRMLLPGPHSYPLYSPLSNPSHQPSSGDFLPTPASPESGDEGKKTTGDYIQISKWKD